MPFTRQVFLETQRFLQHLFLQHLSTKSSSYSPRLNLIEILWRFIKDEWIEVSTYHDWQSLAEYV